MVILGWGIFIFIVGFLIHFLVWKIRLPKRQVKTFLQIYFATLILFLPCLIWADNAFPNQNLLPHSLWEFVHIAFLTTVLILSYMNTYPGIEGDSPSLVIVLAIADAGPEGLHKDVLEKTLNDDLLVRPRIRDLLLDHMAQLKDEKYFLTPKGLIMARVFIFYRSIQGLPKGG